MAETGLEGVDRRKAVLIDHAFGLESCISFIARTVEVHSVEISMSIDEASEEGRV